MIVCSCNVLSDQDVRSAVTGETPPRSTGQVYGCLGCSAQCGRCARTIRKIMDEAIAGVRGGASGHELYRGTCELFQEHGYKTLLTKDLGQTLEEGFFHGLGHGVGLEIHEAPGIGAAAAGTLLAGSAVTVEPGVYLPDRGGVRIEDTLVVCEATVEPPGRRHQTSDLLTQFPKELAILQ